jgi:outer membrane protease
MFLGFDAGYLYGDTTYHISYYIGTSGIESELEFPLQAPLTGVTFGFGRSSMRSETPFSLQATWRTNLGAGYGKMKDSDWATDDIDIITVGAAHPGKDIYSESEIELTANITDVRMAYAFHPSRGTALSPLIGYLRQNYEYDVSNTDQVGYGPYNVPAYTGFIAGKTLAYEITYTMPYAGAQLDLIGDTFSLRLEAVYSPDANAEDRDDHILRYKLSTAKADGDMIGGQLNLEWAAGNAVTIGLSGGYMRISTTGIQTQTFYAGPYSGWTATIDDKISSSQASGFVNVSFGF